MPFELSGGLFVHQWSAMWLECNHSNEPDVEEKTEQMIVTLGYH